MFTLDCFFDDALPPAAAPLLGLGGRALDALTLTFRGPTPEHPDGSVRAEVRVAPRPLFPFAADRA